MHAACLGSLSLLLALSLKGQRIQCGMTIDGHRGRPMTETSVSSVGRAYLEEARRRLAACRERIGHCLGQLDDRQVWWRPHESMNSIANLVLHLCGNLRQWIVAGVGGATDVRDRPQEFAEQGPIPKAELLLRLEEVLGEADAVLAETTERQLLEPRRIQGFDETVLSAIFDSLAHLSGHTQEIICLTRIQCGDAYRFAWTPATPEQGALRAAVPEPKTISVTDVVFEEEVIAAMRPEKPAADPPPLAESSGKESRSGSPLRDPLLELQQEFQSQQGEGKL
jgi:hypothetical protein